MTPTREQIEAARSIAQEEYDHRKATARGEGELLFALRILLAATVPPTDEELDVEGVAWLKRKRTEESVDVRTISRTEAYIAGARREGRR